MERTLADGQSDEIFLDLPANHYLRLEIAAGRLDVKSTLRGPQGEKVAAVFEPRSDWEPDLISLVTALSGPYRLVVVPQDPAKAEGLYRVEIKELRPARPDDVDRVAADAALSAASHLRTAQQPKEALAQAEIARSLWQRLQDHSKEIDTDLEIGAIYRDLSRTQEVLPQFKQALAASIVHGYRQGQLRALFNLGKQLYENEPETAYGYFQEGLSVATILGDAGQQAVALFGLGACDGSRGRSEAALEWYRRALPLAESAKDHSLQANIWNGIATVHTSRGDSDEALRCSGIALGHIGLIDDEESRLAAQAGVLTTFGSLYRRRGELREALARFEEALKINQARGEKLDQARVLIHLGTVYQDLGELERALEIYGEAGRIFGVLEARKWEGIATFNIGQVHLMLGNVPAALEQFESARSTSREAKSPRNEAAALHGLGLARLQLRRAAEAVPFLEEALLLRRQIGDRPGEAATLLVLGRAYLAQGDLERSAVFLRQAEILASQSEASFVRAGALLSLARLSRDRGDLAGALEEIEKSLAILESVRSDLASDSLSASFFATKRSYYEFYVDLLMRLEGRAPGQGYAARALKASEMARARSLLDLLVEGRLNVTKGIPPELKQREAEVGARLAQIQRELMEKLSRTEMDEEILSVLRDRLKQADEERQQVRAEIEREYPRYAEVSYSAPLGLQEIQAQLEREDALLEYSLGAEGSYLFVVTREFLKVYPLKHADEISQRVRQAREGVEGSSERALVRSFQAAHWLYKELVAPAKADITGKRLLIAPDGALNYLSFEALLTAEPTSRPTALQPYLLVDFAVTYVPSASVLPWLEQQDPEDLAGDAAAPKRFVAFADPIYALEALAQEDGSEVRGGGMVLERGGLAEQERWRMPRLKGSEREVSAIARHYRPSEIQIYLRDEAIEEKVKNNSLVEEARRLHFATHGEVNERRPELSGLLLTHSQGSKEDGILQVYEIFNLSLKADLVVLSACNTALGKDVIGEGLVGMTRAFLYAGAPSVMVSLWRVADTTAPELMEQFYENLDRLGSKTEALRQAKLEMVRQGKYSHPYYWAPFILVGKPD
jgi:CHAT domain-containing protein